MPRQECIQHEQAIEEQKKKIIHSEKKNVQENRKKYLKQKGRQYEIILERQFQESMWHMLACLLVVARWWDVESFNLYSGETHIPYGCT